MTKTIPVAVLLVTGLLLTACGSKSYTYEVAFQVVGQGTAEVTVEYPSHIGIADDKDPKSKPNKTTTTEKLPFNQKILAMGLGHVTLSAKSADGQKLSCAVTVEKDTPAGKDGNGTVQCDADITESTDN
jgi:hypothetical protein